MKPLKTLKMAMGGASKNAAPAPLPHAFGATSMPFRRRFCTR
jgi:hypothetical protein